MSLMDALNKEYKAEDVFPAYTVFSPIPIWIIFIYIFNNMGDDTVNLSSWARILVFITIAIVYFQIYLYKKSPQSKMTTSFVVANCILDLIPTILIICFSLVGGMAMGICFVAILALLMVTGILPLLGVYYVALLIKFVKTCSNKVKK